MNVGAAFSRSKAKNRSNFEENVWGPQGDALGGMYGDMSDLWGNSQQGLSNMQGYSDWASNFNQNAANSGFGGYQDLLGGGSYGESDEIRNRLYGSMDSQSGGTNMGKMYQDIVGGEGNSYIDPMVDSMRQSGQEALDKNLGMGAMGASAMGQGGSSRHAMSDAMLKQGALSDMNRAETNMRAGAYDKDMDWKMKIAGMADQGVGDQQDRLMSMLAGRDRSVGGGMQYGQNMQNMGMGAMAPQMQQNMAPWQMMQMYNSGMGDPTVLGKGSERSSSSGQAHEGSFGMMGGA